MTFDFSKPDLLIRLSIFLINKVYRFLRNLSKKVYIRPLQLNEPRAWIEVKIVELRFERLPEQFHNYRVVQFSDLHMGTWLDEKKLHEAVSKVNEINPDLVVITGDFVTENPDHYAKILIDELKQLSTKDGVVAVLGNHDHWTDAIMIRKILDSAGIQDLSNRIIYIRRRDSRIAIGGLDDITENLHDIDSLADPLSPGTFCILLAHEPDIADQSATTDLFDLQLSGHTHGGQVRFPFIGTLVLPKHGKKYPRGLYQVKRMILYTNSGLGTAELDFRYNCPPEITVFVLKSDNRTGTK